MRDIGDAESEFDDSATSVIPASDEWDDEAPADDSPAPARGWAQDLWRRKINLKPVPVILIVLILISGGITAWLYAKLYRPDQQVGPSVARAAVSAASDGTVALLSYSSDTLDKDIAAARSHLGGDFLDYYNQFTQQFVVPGPSRKR